jgi:hypothetical protein
MLAAIGSRAIIPGFLRLPLCRLPPAPPTLLCHRWGNLPSNAGIRESLMYIAQLTEGAGIMLCALFLDINAFAFERPRRSSPITS